ncbi:hypothetical protein D9M70_499390 [compost metagenome]
MRGLVVVADGVQAQVEVERLRPPAQRHAILSGIRLIVRTAIEERPGASDETLTTFIQNIHRGHEATSRWNARFFPLELVEAFERPAALEQGTHGQLLGGQEQLLGLGVRYGQRLVGIDRRHGRSNTVVGEEQALTPQQCVLPQTHADRNIKRRELPGNEGIQHLGISSGPLTRLVGELVVVHGEGVESSRRVVVVAAVVYIVIPGCRTQAEAEVPVTSVELGQPVHAIHHQRPTVEVVLRIVGVDVLQVGIARTADARSQRILQRVAPAGIDLANLELVRVCDTGGDQCDSGCEHGSGEQMTSDAGRG